jgi:hypothetical protein
MNVPAGPHEGVYAVQASRGERSKPHQPPSRTATGASAKGVDEVSGTLVHALA